MNIFKFKNNFTEIVLRTIILLGLIIIPTSAFAEIAINIWDIVYTSEKKANEEANSIVVDSEGNIYVAGKIGASLFNDILLLKYNSSGILQWEKTIDGNKSDDEALSLAIDTEDNVYIASKSRTTIAYGELISKYNKDGFIVWKDASGEPANLRFDNNIHVEPRGIIIDSDNNIVVTGLEREGSRVRMYIAKFQQNEPGQADENGLQKENLPVELWRKYYSFISGRTEGYAIDVDANNNYYVAGSYFLNLDGQTNDPIDINSRGDFLVVKFSSTGDELRSIENRYDFGFREQAAGIKVAPSGNIYIAGTSNKNLSSFIIIKLDPAGTLLWQKDFFKESLDTAFGLSLDPAENVYITGSSDGNILTLKLDKYGNNLWTKTFDQSHSDRARAIFMENNGDFIITGSTVPETNFDILTIKYSQSDNNMPTFDFSNQYPTGLSTITGIDTLEFIYQIEYTDLDNDQPEYVRVEIDGVSHDMSNISDCGTGCNGIFSDGETYSYTHTFSTTGSHDYQFFANDGLTRIKTGLTLKPDVISSRPVISTNPLEINLTAKVSATSTATFTVTNNGSPGGGWNATTSDNRAGLSNNSGSYDESVTLTIDSIGLINGFYGMNVEITDTDAEKYVLPLNLTILNPEGKFRFVDHRQFDSGNTDNGVGITSVQDGKLFMLETLGDDIRLILFDPKDIDNIVIPRDANAISNTAVDVGRFVKSNDRGEIFVSYESGDNIKITKYNIFLTKVWTRAYDNGGKESLISMGLDHTGNSYLLVKEETEQYNMVIHDVDGNIKPVVPINTGTSEPVSIYIDTNLSIFIGSTTSNFDFQMQKIDFEYNDQGSFTFDGGGQEILTSMMLDNKNHIITAGESSGDMFVAKFNPIGELIFSQTYNTADTSIVKAIAIDSFDNIYLAGQDNKDIHIVKYDLNGVEIWSGVYDSGSIDKVTGIAISDLSNIFLSGTILKDTTVSNTIHFSQQISGEVRDPVVPDPEPDDNSFSTREEPKTTSGCFISTLSF